MLAVTVPLVLPASGAITLGVCAELLQPPGFTKFILSLWYVLGSGDVCIDLLCQVVASAKHKTRVLSSLFRHFFSDNFCRVVSSSANICRSLSPQVCRRSAEV